MKTPKEFYQIKNIQIAQKINNHNNSLSYVMVFPASVSENFKYNRDISKQAKKKLYAKWYHDLSGSQIYANTQDPFYKDRIQNPEPLYDFLMRNKDQLKIRKIKSIMHIYQLAKLESDINMILLPNTQEEHVAE
ncbi:MAG: hypothetical protein IJW59_03440 [Clostridia bacterium]|nr:hypothetical protein [Clostridia bacterium]